MVQKIIWMQLLLIGILSSFQSCDNGEVDKAYYEEYYFVNESDYEIVIETLNKIDDGYNRNNYILSKDSTLYQELELNFGSITGIIAHSDSVVVEFGDIKRVSYLPYIQSIFNILDHSNYDFIKKAENHVEYTYTFTNDDFENANDIE